MLQSTSSHFGQLHVECSTAGQQGLALIAPSLPVQVLRWSLPQDLSNSQDCLPPLELLAVTDAHGEMRIVPPHGFGRFIRQCYGLGAEILSVMQNHSSVEAFSYRAHWQAYRYTQSRAIKFRRSFTSAADLVIKPALQSDSLESTILPHTLGLDAQGRGRRWGIQKFFDKGRAAAHIAGIARPTTQQMVAHALFTAALHQGLTWNPQQVKALIRAALYDRSSELVVTPHERSTVVSRFCQALQEHQNDSEPKFHKWFASSRSNLPKSLASRSTDSFGSVPVEVVKVILADLGWDAHFAITSCVQASMNWVERCLGDNLSAAARVRFGLMYYPQAAFGGLSLPLLMDRAPLIKPFVSRIWESPGEEPLIAALHTTLHHYAEMVTHRRELDRRAKSMHQKGTRMDPRSSQADSEIAPAHEETVRRRIEAVVSRAAKESGRRCRNCGGELVFEIDAAACVQDEAVEAVGTCPLHPTGSRRIEISWTAFAEAI